MDQIDKILTGGGQLLYCDHCSAYHVGRCPRIKAIEYYPDGAVKRVEYYDTRNP